MVRQVLQLETHGTAGIAPNFSEALQITTLTLTLTLTL